MAWFLQIWSFKAWFSLEDLNVLQCFEMRHMLITSWQNASLCVFKGLWYILCHWKNWLGKENFNLLLIVISNNLPDQNVHLNHKKAYVKTLFSKSPASTWNEHVILWTIMVLDFKCHNMILLDAQTFLTSHYKDLNSLDLCHTLCATNDMIGD